jgi:hypothetical protein
MDSFVSGPCVVWVRRMSYSHDVTLRYRNWFVVLLFSWYCVVLRFGLQLAFWICLSRTRSIIVVIILSYSGMFLTEFAVHAVDLCLDVLSRCPVEWSPFDCSVVANRQLGSVA